MAKAGSYDYFVQAVRRHRTSELLRMLAIVSSHTGDGPTTDLDVHQFPGFALAGIAKASVIAGNEHRPAGVSVRDVRSLVSAFIQVPDPLITDGQVWQFEVRMSFEQFPWQDSPFYDAARCMALLVTAAEESDQTLISGDYWHGVLGCTVEQFLSIALFLHTSAVSTKGAVLLDDLENEALRPITELLPCDLIRSVAVDRFIITRDEFREEACRLSALPPGLERFDFNPLLLGPFVQLPGQLPTAPVPRAIWLRASPRSLYFDGLAADGIAFTRALGTVFEHYVGKQLHLSAPQDLYPEIAYGKPEKKSVDHIAVFPNAVLLVEAKVKPMVASARAGGASLEDDMDKTVHKAFEQIEATVDCVRNGVPEFGHIPTDRPFLGIVVTMDPYYGANSPLGDAGEHGSVYKGVCSSRELEDLVCVEGRTLADVLLAIADDPGRRKWSIRQAAKEAEFGRNSLLDAGWAALPVESLRESFDESSLPRGE